MNTINNNLLSSIKDPAIAREVLKRIRSTKINILLIGATGVGKSSTISALFENYGNGEKSQAKVGQTSNPETIDVSAHELGSLVIWDTPGIGDSTEKDIEHKGKIISLLNEMDSDGNPLIDLIFLVLDAGSKDFSSAYRLIREVVLPNIAPADQKNLLIGINQADMALKGRYWNEEDNKPETKLIERLDELILTVRTRIKEDTGLNIEPIYYAAGFQDRFIKQQPYNLQKLLSFILERLPEKKRAAVATHINQKKENFKSNDNKENYDEKVEKSVFASVLVYIKEFAEGTMNIARSVLNNDEVKALIKSIALDFVTNLLKKKSSDPAKDENLKTTVSTSNSAQAASSS